MATSKCPNCGESLPSITDAFCPFCSNSLEATEVLAQHSANSTLTSKANATLKVQEMIGNGATPGMIKAKLRNDGFQEDEIDSLIRDCKAQSSAENRLRGTGWMVVGLLMIGVGVGYLANGHNFAHGRRGLIAAVVLVLAGISLLGRGFVAMVYGVDDRE